jgi:NADH-quinone oxidoreductase subunit L
MRAMGGLRKFIPVTFWTMTVATFAIAGFFPFAGFFSKDSILYAAFISGAGGKVLWLVGWTTSLLTSFYMFRLWYLTFFGERRASAQPHAHDAQHGHGHDTPHESPWTMLAPLCVLAVLSLIGGWIGWPEALGGSDRFAAYLAPVFADMHAASETANSSGHMEILLAAIAMLAAILGWFVADLFYRRKPQLPKQFAEKCSGIYRLLLNKYWMDELYAAVVARPLEAVSRVVLFRGVDNFLIDGATRASSGGAMWAGAWLRRIQSGNLRSYAGWIAAGAAVLLLLGLGVGR